jgi:hypothetical protein
MKTLLLAGVAALFLATGTAHAESALECWGPPGEGCWIMCISKDMREQASHGWLDCILREDMPLPRRRPKRAPK